MNSSSELSWLLERELGCLDEVRHALLLSDDGLLQARTGGLERDVAERLAAIAAALGTAAKAFTAETGGSTTRQLIQESDQHLVLVAPAADGWMLCAVTTSPAADVGLLRQRMTRLALRVGRDVAGPLRGEDVPPR